MRITWLNSLRVDIVDGALTSHRVEMRLRCTAAAAEFSKRGHKTAIAAAIDAPYWINDPNFYHIDVAIVGKPFVDLSPILRRIRDAGGKIILDICDNVFEPPEDLLKGYYEAILNLADGVVVSSEPLRAAIEPRLPAGIPMAAIPEFVEGIRLMPAFAPSAGVIKLLWFGYPNHHPNTWAFLPALRTIRQNLKVELCMVSLWPAEARSLMEQNAAGLDIRLLDWGPRTLSDELAHCDLVIIPGDDSPARRTKSANRIITTLWAGKYAVAYPLPSYAEFAPFAGIGKDLPANIRWALDNPAEVPARIAAGQDYIATHYSTAQITDAWEAFATRIVGNKRI
jgi:glycosyltransferase involved in cell wall biosynthesis